MGDSVQISVGVIIYYPPVIPVLTSGIRSLPHIAEKKAKTRDEMHAAASSHPHAAGKKPSAVNEKSTGFKRCLLLLVLLFGGLVAAPGIQSLFKLKPTLKLKKLLPTMPTAA